MLFQYGQNFIWTGRSRQTFEFAISFKVSGSDITYATLCPMKILPIGAVYISWKYRKNSAISNIDRMYLVPINGNSFAVGICRSRALNLWRLNSITNASKTIVPRNIKNTTCNMVGVSIVTGKVTLSLVLSDQSKFRRRMSWMKSTAGLD